MAMIAGIPAVVSLLMSKGGDLNLANAKLVTPLHLIAEYNHLEIVKMALSANANRMYFNNIVIFS